MFSQLSEFLAYAFFLIRLKMLLRAYNLTMNEITRSLNVLKF